MVGEYDFYHILDTGQAAGVKLMIDSGAVIPAGALCWALANECGLDVLELLKDCDMNAPRQKDGLTPYQLASRLGRVEHKTWLVEHGANADLDEIQTVLDFVAVGKVEEARKAMSAVSDFEQKLTKADRGLIATLAWHGNTEGVRALLALGFSPSAPSSHGDQAIHAACYVGAHEIVRLLIEAGADVNAVESQFNGTPLGWCEHAESNGFRSFGDRSECVRLLIAAGAKMA